jgi:hypothetical protein
MAEYLSDEQVNRYGRFPADPSAEDLERFFYLDAAGLAKVADSVVITTGSAAASNGPSADARYVSGRST